MRQASDKLKEKVYNGNAKFYQEAHIVFQSGQEKDLGMKNFYLSGNGFSDGAGTNSLALGQAMAKTINIILVNDEDQLSEHDFYHSVITIWCCCDVEGSAERIKIGTFTIDIPTAREGEIEVTGTDDMYKGDIDYNTSLSFPATAKQILIDSCRTCGVSLKKDSFANDGFIVNKKPTQCTHRSVWGMIAMLAGGNARMDENNLLEIVSYDLSFFARKGLDGGVFDDGESLYKTGDAADGGNFLDYSSGDVYDGGNFEELSRYHMFYKSQTPTIDTDDVVITGVQASSGDSHGVCGKEGYVLTLENQLIAGKVQEGVNAIGALIVGMRFRPFSVDHTAYPLAEFGDICYVFDRKGNYYQSVVTDVNFSFYGYTTIKCSADSVMRNRSEFKPAAANIVADVEKQTEEKFEDVIQDTSNRFDEVEQETNNRFSGVEYEIGNISESVGNLDISLKRTSEGLEAEVKRAKGEEGILSGRISLTETNISLEVSRAQNAENSLSSRINIEAGNITAEVTRASRAEGELSGRISIAESNINLKVSKGEIVAAINLSPEAVDIDASKINLNGAVTANSNFKINLDGTIESTGGIFDQSCFTQGIYLALNRFNTSYKYPVVEMRSAGFLSFCNTATHSEFLGSVEFPNSLLISNYRIDVYKNTSFSQDITVSGDAIFTGTLSNTTSSAANVRIGAAGKLNTVTSGSLRKWKHAISDLGDESINHHRLYEVKPLQFIYNNDYLSKNDIRSEKLIPGFVLDGEGGLLENYPIAVEFDEYGNPESWNEHYLIAPILKLIQEHKENMDHFDLVIKKIIKKIGGI